MNRLISLQQYRFLCRLLVCTVITVGVTTFFCGVRSFPAWSRGLRALDIGEVAPEFDLPLLDGKDHEKFSPAAHKASVILFIATESDYQKSRVFPFLSGIGELNKKYGSRVEFIGVYTNTNGGSDLTAYLNKNSIPLKILDDSELAVYNTYGVFITPVAVVTTDGGRIVEIVPYTHNIIELIEGNVKVALGEWTTEEMAQSLVAENIEKSPEEKAYRRRMSYGMVMVSRRMYPQAAREFANAIEIMPDITDAYLELANVQLAMREWQLARENFSKVIEKQPDSLEAAAGLGLAYNGLGETEKALVLLEKIAQNPNSPEEPLIALAEIYSGQGRLTDSLVMYKRALVILKNHYSKLTAAQSGPEEKQ